MNFKASINEFFEKVINDIDVETETELLSLESRPNINEEVRVRERQLFNSLRFELISQVNSIKQSNLKVFEQNTNLFQILLDKFKSIIDYEQNAGVKLKKELSLRYCYFFKRDTLKNYFESRKIGVLLITDWFISDHDFKKLL